MIIYLLMLNHTQCYIQSTCYQHLDNVIRLHYPVFNLKSLIQYDNYCLIAEKIVKLLGTEIGLLLYLKNVIKLKF